MDDSLVEGWATFQAIAYDRNEAVPTGRQGIPVKDFVAHLQPGQPLTISAPARILGIPDILIARSVVQSLPADGLLELRWQWSRKRGES